MVKKDLVVAKLSELALRLTRAESKLPASAAELSRDADALDIVSFNLMLAVRRGHPSQQEARRAQ